MCKFCALLFRYQKYISGILWHCGKNILMLCSIMQIIPGSPLTKVLNFKVRIGNVDITAQLTKKEVAPTSVKFTGAATPFKMKVDEEITLDASVEPADATDKAVTWTSTNTAVATVSDQGVVTAIAEGTTTIKVATSNGKFYEQALTVEAVDLAKAYMKWNVNRKKFVAPAIPAPSSTVPMKDDRFLPHFQF